LLAERCKAAERCKLMLKDSLCQTEITTDSAPALPCMSSDHTSPLKPDILAVADGRTKDA